MLSAADADIVRRDPVIPGLIDLLDCEAFVAMLHERLPQVRFESPQVSYLRYKPGMDCLAGYQLMADGVETIVYAAAYGPNARDKLANARNFHAIAGPLGPGRIMVEERGVVVYFFPNDRKISGLSRLWRQEQRHDAFRELFRQSPHLAASSLSVLRYKPQRRLVALARGVAESQAILKIYRDAGYRQPLVNARAFESRGVLRIARLVGHLDAVCTLAFEWCPGRPLFDPPGGPPCNLKNVELVGAALAELHQQSAANLLSSTGQIERASILAAASSVGFTCPGLAGGIEKLASRLCERLADEPTPRSPMHGDFYDKQVLLTDNRVSILDLDEAVRGNALADLGNFMAHLQYDAVCGATPSDQIKSIQDALLEGYSAERRGSMSNTALGYTTTSLALYAAIGLLRLAPHPFRQRLTDWPERTTAIVERAEKILESVHRPLRTLAPASASWIAVSDPFGAAADASMPFLRQALDGRQVESRLRDFAPQLAAAGRLELRAIRVTRYKPQRRCLIEYDLEIRGNTSACEFVTLIGKVRAKGIDTRTYKLLAALGQKGFGADSEEGVSVPEPIGVITDFHMWLQRKVPGVMATGLLAESGGTALARRIAEAIHRVHQANIPSDRRHTLEDEQRILRERLASVASRNPQSAHRIDTVIAACDRLALTVPEPKYCGSHRDFYADQVIVDGSRLYLVDFDLYCQADPALDVANFLAHLMEQSLRTLGSPEALADRGNALVERFVQLSGESTRNTLSAYTSLTLARHIYLSTQFPARKSLTEALIQLCERRLGLAEITSPRLGN